MFSYINKDKKVIVIDEKYDEYLGFVYGEIIRDSLYDYALDNKLNCIPLSIGKWWGNIMLSGKWTESEIDVVVNKNNVGFGECKYRNKKVGVKELESLKKTTYLLASKCGFSDELLNAKDDNLLLVCNDEFIKSA